LKENRAFHYTTAVGLKGILDKKCIYCSRIQFMNDPSEDSYGESIISEFVNSDKEMKKIYEILFNKSFEDSVLLGNGKYVASFSRNSDSLPMWNYYSKGNGYNIGFSLEEMVRQYNLSFPKASIVDIIYDKDQQLDLLKEYFTQFSLKVEKYLELESEKEKSKFRNNESRYYELEYASSRIIEDFTNGLYLIKHKFKHPAYSAEEEVRVLIETDFDYSNYKYRISENGIFVEYVELLFEPMNDIIRFTLHPLMNELHVQGLNLLLKKYGIESNGNVHQSYIPFQTI
jgi:hypothetical protein